MLWDRDPPVSCGVGMGRIRISLVAGAGDTFECTDSCFAPCPVPHISEL